MGTADYRYRMALLSSILDRDGILRRWLGNRYHGKTPSTLARGPNIADPVRVTQGERC